jgi:hypothetical protein
MALKNMDNNFASSIIKNKDKNNKIFDFFKNSNKIVVSAVSAFAILTISGSALYLANFSKFSNNRSITSEDADAAPVITCALDLTLDSPTPSPTPVITPTSSPTASPTIKPTPTPTAKPTASPTVKPTASPTVKPTATASPLACVSCQYQSDLFYGPVITSFAGGLRYGNTRRIKSSGINTNLPACNLLPVSPQASPVLPVLSSSCKDPVAKKYLVGKIDTTSYKVPKGYLIGTITNNTKNCTYDVGFASYKANGTNIDIQNLYDYKTGVIRPGATIKFIIKSPANNDAVSCHNLP